MRRRLPLNLALAALAAAIAALLILDRPRQPPEVTLTSLEQKAIETVALRFPNADTIRLARDDAGWHLRAPIDVRAETSSVAQLLALATRVSHRQIPSRDIEAGEVGLDAPEPTVTFNDRIEVALGATQPIDNRRYARVGDTVHLIDAPGRRALDADYAELVARRLLPPDAIIKRIELPGTSLTPTDQGGWDIAPDNADRGADAAQQTVDAWSRAEALSVATAEDRTADGRAVVTTRKYGEFVFEIVARQPQLLLRRADIGVLYRLGGHRAAAMLDLRHDRAEGGTPELKSRSEIPLGPDGATP